MQSEQQPTEHYCENGQLFLHTARLKISLEVAPSGGTAAFSTASTRRRSHFGAPSARNSGRSKASTHYQTGT